MRVAIAVAEDSGDESVGLSPPGGALSDEEIVERVLAGDLPSFEIIMRRYNQRIFRIARSILRDDDEAEDVTQDAYVRAFEHLAQFSGLAKFSTWLTRIALHEALARRRRRERLHVVDLNDPHNFSMVPLMATPGPEHATSVKELHGVLTAAVDELPDDLRTVFAMRLIEGLDTAETAACLELSEANVKVRLHRARSVLRERLEARLGASVRELYEFGGHRCDRIVRSVLARISGGKSDVALSS
jgi:RNA polymerase sigma-70 factor (ECF subfamily)